MGPRGVRAGPRVGPLCGVGGRLLGGFPLLSANNHFSLVACVGPGRRDADRRYCDQTVTVTTASQNREWGDLLTQVRSLPCSKSAMAPHCPLSQDVLQDPTPCRVNSPPGMPSLCPHVFSPRPVSGPLPWLCSLLMLWSPGSFTALPYLRVSSSGASSLQPHLTPNLPQPSLLPDTTSTPRGAAVMPTAPWEIQPVC